MVKKKKTFPAIFAADSHRIMFEMLVAGVLMLAAMYLPFLRYSYGNKSYSLSGLSLIMGKTVCGGSTVLGSSVPVILMAVMALLIIISALLAPILKKKICAGIEGLALVVHFACNIYTASTASKLLPKAINVQMTIGSIVCLVIGLAAFVRCLYILWRLKTLSTLDFMLAPGMLYFVINNYIPMLGISIAFKKIDYSVGIFESPWTGFENFKQLFATRTGSFWESDAFLITKNTLLYNVTFIVLGIVTGVLVGICLSELFSRRLQKFFQTSILLPQLISYVIVAYIVYAFLSNDAGLVNHLLGEGNEVNFYAETVYWPFIIIFIYIWKMVGYNAIIFLASIVGIDRSLYEAAKVDGCSKLKQIRYVTLPLLKPTIITLFMLEIGRIMYSDFGLFYQVPLNAGALYPVTQTIDTYVYRMLMTMNNISIASAASTYQAVLGFVLVMTVNIVVRRKNKESALF